MKLILMDTAYVEFYDYKAIPHLARPVLNKVTDCAETLRWLSQELDNRLGEIMRAGHRNIQAYNAAGGLMPYIVVVIDRLHDLTCGNCSDVVSNLSRLTALARATGIHLVAATNRANDSAVPPSLLFPGRIAFKARFCQDSIFWIRDTQACELQNRGDMLVLRPNRKFTVAHCDYLFDEDKSKIIRKIGTIS